MSEASGKGRYSGRSDAALLRDVSRDYASERMAQQHLDRLSALDASFLHQEGPESHMHIGALTLFDAPAPQFDELLALIGARLHLVPRYRQRLPPPPLARGPPRWAAHAPF